MYRNNALMLNLTAVSLFCLMVLTGLYLYSGSLLPATNGAGALERASIWLLWIALIGLPLLMGVLWAMRLMQSRN